MSPNPPIVPSRNALRALRRLAYGGSTIVAAVGSVFTVAGISYDTQRRVRLAERLIETKRTIRSVSNSNGAAHVARMFEAAEKGEDFGLEMTRSWKQSTRRDSFALTTEDAQRRPPEGSEPGDSYRPLVEDETSDRRLVDKGSSSRKELVRRLQTSTRIFTRSSSSPQWLKGLPQEFPLLDQGRIVPKKVWRTRTYDDPIEPYDRAQAVRELPRTAPPSAKRVLIEGHLGMRKLVDTAGRRSDEKIQDLEHIPRKSENSTRGSGEKHRAVERILASTQQQHKRHNHGVYGRPGKEPLAQQGTENVSTPKYHGLKSNSSAAEKLITATQQQHKLHSHPVYGRPGRTSTDVHARLNEHVALWLNTDGVSRSNSDLKYGPGGQGGFALGGVNNSKRLGSKFKGDDPHHKPLRRNLSTLACAANAVSRGPSTKARSSRQMDNQESSGDWPKPFQPTSDDHTIPCGPERTQSVPLGELRPPARSKRRRREESTVHWSRRYSHYSLFPPKQKATAVEANQGSKYTGRELLSSRQREVPITLDLEFKPWPVSVSGTFDILGNSTTPKYLPENSRSNEDSVQHAVSNVVNDLSEGSPTPHVSRPSPQDNPSQRRSDAFFGSDKAFEQCVTKAKTGGYAVWDDYIQTAVEEYGTPTARTIWLKAMACYAAPGESRNWDLVDILHSHFYEKFWPALPPYLDSDAGRLLTRHVLRVAPTSQRAAELLFPLDGKELELEAEFAAKGLAYTTVQRSRNLFANASKYLQDLWDDEDDAEKVVSELRKVIQVAKMQDIELAEDLFFGTIRRLSSNGQIEQAQALFDEMIFYHHIEPSFLTRSVLVCGHARAGDWDRVAQEIEAMHNVHDLSRREPLGYSLMFNDVLIEYASRRSIAQTHDLLVHALGYWGLVPTSAVSATAIQAFLTHRRFDLVREWIETVRILFPQVDTETSRFAWHLGSVWEDINASCVEVEETCRALCFRRDASEVQASLREMVRLALARDLATKLHAAEVAETGRKGRDSFHADSPWALDHFLERAQSFMLSMSADGESQRTESQEARELLSQVESVARLDKLFGTKGKLTDLPSLKIQGSSQPRSSQNTIGPIYVASLQSHVPTDLMRDVLPSLPKVERLLDQYYSIRQNEGLPISHEILKYTCQKLRRADRKIDLMKLLKAMFDSAYVQGPAGVMFDLSIMEMWLWCAHETKSISQALVVFWAVLDAGEEYVLTSKFVLLARMTYNKVGSNRFDELSTLNPSKHEELGYLLHRLSQKLWGNYEGAGPAIDKPGIAKYRKLSSQMKRRQSICI